MCSVVQLSKKRGPDQTRPKTKKERKQSGRCVTGRGTGGMETEEGGERDGPQDMG